MAIKLSPNFSPSPVSGSSATLKPAPAKSIGTAASTSAAPKPAVSNFVPTTASIPASSGMQVGAWYNGQQWDGSKLGAPGQIIVGAQPSNSNQGYSIPEPQDLSPIYNPIYENYNRDEQLVNDNYTGQEGLLNENLTNAQNILARTKTERQDYNKAQEDDLNKQLQSAYSQAVRAHNALGQQSQARFGRGNSAGEASQEIANQEFFRQQGAVQSTHLQNVGAMQADFRRFLTWSADEDVRLASEHKAQLLQLQMQKNQSINQIQNNRNITRSEQARGVIEQQNLYNQRKADLQNQLAAEQRAIEQYGQKMKMDLDAQIKLIDKQKYATPQGAFNNDVASTIGNVGAAPTSGTEVNPFQLAHGRYPAQDEFDNNPYFSTA